MATGTEGPLQRFLSLALSQKINYTFAFFFLVNAIQNLHDYGGFFDPFKIAAVAMVVVFVVLAQFDNVFIRYLQVMLLLILSLLTIGTNSDPSQLSGFILMSISLAAAYKMSLFGRRTLPILAVAVAFAVGFSYWAGMIHGFSILQRINIANFVIVYLGLLFFIFEEETLSLRRQRDILTMHANELQPFAELGNNVAGLVHDFRNDVARLYALASIERMSGNTDVGDTLGRYADRINERVESVLYVATAADHSEAEEIGLREMLQRVVYYFVEVNRGLKHQINLELTAPEEITVISRRNALLVILENVIKNSIEATEGCADRTIEIKLSEFDDGARIAIDHYGKHMPGDQPVDSVIDVRKSNFFRRGRSSRTGGTGLGMINVIRALEVLDAGMTMRNTTSGVRSIIELPSECCSAANPVGE